MLALNASRARNLFGVTLCCLCSMGAFVGHQGTRIFYDAGIDNIWQLRHFETFCEFGVVCDGSYKPHFDKACIGACCVFRHWYVRMWYSLASLDRNLSHNGFFTSSMAEVLAVTIALRSLQRGLQKSPEALCVIYTDQKEFMGTLLAAVAEYRISSSKSQRSKHKKMLKGKTVGFWVWLLVLFTAIEELLRDTRGILRIQQVQSVGVQVNNHRWHLPKPWLDPHHMLGNPSDLLDIMCCSLLGPILKHVKEKLIQLNIFDEACDARSLLIGSLRSHVVRVVGGAFLEEDVVSVDLQVSSADRAFSSDVHASPFYERVCSVSTGSTGSILHAGVQGSISSVSRLAAHAILTPVICHPAHGFQLDGKDHLWCVLVAIQDSVCRTVIGKGTKTEAWYGMNGKECHVERDIQYAGSLLRTSEPHGDPVCYQAGYGHLYFAIAITEYGDIPAKATFCYGDEPCLKRCWYTYGGTELVAETFQYLSFPVDR